MNFYEEFEALRAEIRDVRNDAVGPVERLAAENTELRKLLKRTYKHFTAITDALKQEIKTMAATITDVQNNLATLKTTVDQVVAQMKAAATPEQVDAVNTSVVALNTELQGLLTPAAPAPTPAPAA